MRNLKRSGLSILLVCGLMTACTDTGAPAAAVIDGTVGGWTAGAGTVTLREGSTVLSSGTLNGDGTFRLPLPAASAVTPYLTTGESLTPGEADCSADVSRALNVRAYPVTTLTATAGGSSQTIVPLTFSVTTTPAQTTVTIDGRLWLYVDRDLSYKQTVTCTSTTDGLTVSGRLTANLDLKTGWNVLKYSGSATYTLSGTTLGGSADLTLEGTSDTASTWTGESQALPLSAAGVGSREAALRGTLEKMMPFRR